MQQSALLFLKQSKGTNEIPFSFLYMKVKFINFLFRNSNNLGGRRFHKT